MNDLTKVKVLGGLRVLELADEKEEFCGKLAADMGADVIKIEPHGGNKTRTIGPFVDDIPDPNKSISFWYNNTSKRSITLNIGCESGREIFKQLALKADVILEAFSPGYLNEIGLEFETLSKMNPRLIMVSITTFGQTGPYRHFKDSDLVNMAMGGPVHSCGYDSADVPDAPPIRPDGYQSYIMGGYQGFIGMLLALYERDIKGIGQHVDCSIHEACSLSTEGAIPMYSLHKKIVQRHTGRYASMKPTPQREFICRDGRYVNIFGLPRNEENWHAWISWMDEYNVPLGDFKNMTFKDIRALLAASGDHPEVMEPYTKLLTTFTAKLTAEEIYHGGQKRGLLCAVIRSPEETLEDPHFKERGLFVEVEHPEIGRDVTYPGAPFISNKMKYEVHRAPLVGEHNLEIYSQELGFSREKLGKLSEAGVI